MAESANAPDEAPGLRLGATGNVRAIFLDRDGVLNRSLVREGKPYPPRTLAEFSILPGVVEALNQLKAARFLLIVVTNQPDIARGTETIAAVGALNEHLHRLCPMLNEILVCPHDDADHCDCRKPKPGMLLDAAKRHAISLANSWMIGDRWRDVEAGQRAGCKTVWINVGYAERGPDKVPDFEARSLPEAAKWILARDPRDGAKHAPGI